MHRKSLSQVSRSILKRLRIENVEKTKTHDCIDLGYFGAKSQSRFQNIDWVTASFASSSCLCFNFVISVLFNLHALHSLLKLSSFCHQSIRHSENE